MAGDLIAKFAAIQSAQRRPGDKALDLLDKAVAEAKSVSGFTPDAEFEASHPTQAGIVHPILADWTDPHPLAPLGMLMVEAFAPNGLRDLPRYWFANGVPDDYPDGECLEEEATEAWWTEIKEPFRDRYGLC
jgi:hypothetical protein